jgi:hypothetical protein
MGAVCDAHRFDAGNGSSFGARLRNLTDLGRVLAPPITRFTRKAAARVACSSARRSVATDPRSPLLPVDELFSALDAMTRNEMGLELLRIWQANRKTVTGVTPTRPTVRHCLGTFP